MVCNALAVSQRWLKSNCMACHWVCASITESKALVAALLVLTDGALGTVGVIGAGAVAAGAVGTICAVGVVGAVDAVGADIVSLLGVALVEDSVAGDVTVGAGVLVSLTVLSVGLVWAGVGSTGVSATASAVFFCNICGRYGLIMPR